MRHLTLPALILCSASMANADGHYTASFANDGINSTIVALSAISDPTPSDQFALGGAHFLAAVEGALQTRYEYGLIQDRTAQQLDLPFLRLPIGTNPDPKLFDATKIAAVFEDARADLAQASATLRQISDTDAVAVQINIADLWFDINMNETRDAGEDVALFLADQMGSSAPVDAISVVFDTADAAWLSAYAEVLSGMSSLILSLDPTQAITAVYNGAAAFDDLRDSQIGGLGFWGEGEIPMIDMVAAAIVGLEGQPDATQTRAAHAHFLTAIADNRVFWARLDAEVDNRSEWIPNAQQTSALPIPFAPDLGASWQAVLSDAKGLLKGDLLLPHWRLGQGAGLNLSKMLQNPPDIDLIGVFQGYSLAPYAERGPVIDMQSLRDFDEVTQGNSPFFAILLN